ncbi:MAG: DUF1643 domain-containing protein [Acetobacter sp.]|nr:DUF1643 domain-containing protein [Acetobacter sp.]MBQ5479814.1 DUF1643 domain-containing protein [Acetobacter sp.]MBQ5515663.1 DUF1643 domain-containing protein [Acetobacter sp.]
MLENDTADRVLAKEHHVGSLCRLKLSQDVVSFATYGGHHRCYRYTLKRVWDSALPMVMWVLMNPSVATEEWDDRTVAKCQRYTRKWGYGGLFVGNTFAYRCTDQKRLLEVEDPIGPENNAALLDMAKQAHLIIAAYGSPHYKTLWARGTDVLHLLRSHGFAVHALKLSSAARPCHPLYLSSTLLPFPLI